MSDTKLIRVTTSWYCAGMVIHKEGLVVEAAPILKRWVGKPYKDAFRFLLDKHKAKLEDVKEKEDGKMDNE